MANETGATLDEAVSTAVGEGASQNGNQGAKETSPASQAQVQPELDQRTKDAILLYDALENPNSRNNIVQELARRAGLNITETPKAATENVLDTLKEGVPPEYHFLIDNLSPAIQKIVKKEIAAGLEPLNRNISERQLVETKRDVDLAYEKARAKHKDFDEVEPKMREIAKRMTMGPNADLNEYIEDIYSIASRDKAESKAVAGAVNKINKNAKEVTPTSAEVQPGTVKLGSKLPSINEAIKAAMRGERLE